MSLTRADIVAQALDLLDEQGFETLSMRRVATSLAIQPSALYWHVASKQELLQAMAADILAATPPLGGPSWQEDVRAWADGLRLALLARRDGAELVASVLAMRPVGIEPAETLAPVLVGAGLPPAEAAAAAATVLHFVMGHCVDEQGHDQMRMFGVAEQADESAGDRFRYGLDLLVAGTELAVVRASL